MLENTVFSVYRSIVLLHHLLVLLTQSWELYICHRDTVLDRLERTDDVCYVGLNLISVSNLPKKNKGEDEKVLKSRGFLL